jgi:hypothetical protein
MDLHLGFFVARPVAFAQFDEQTAELYNYHTA